jgi:hypothetical protein
VALFAILQTYCGGEADVRQMKKVLGYVSRYRKAGIYFFMGIILMLGVIGIANRQAIYDQFYDWKLIPRPERLTELYFTDHRNIPQAYAPGKALTMSFTVRNLEHRATGYDYTISQTTTDGTAKQLADGSFSLAHEHKKAVSVRVVPADLGTAERSRFVVTISYQGIAFGEDSPSTQKQSIYYWTSKGDIQ